MREGHNPYKVRGGKIKRKVRMIAVTSDPMEVINMRTGEVKTATPFMGRRVFKDQTDFIKVYNPDAMGKMSDRALKVFLYGMREMGFDGRFLLRTDECSAMVGLKKSSIMRGVQDLLEMNAISRHQKGVYWINPNIAFRGNRDDLLEENAI